MAHFEKLIVYCYMLVALSASMCFHSRSFIIGCLIAAVYLIIKSSGILIRPFLKFIIMLCLVVLTGLLAFFFKSHSTSGRLLIYKISLPMLNEHFINGVGWGKFPNSYMHYQEKYFESGKYTISELLLAGNIHYVYNDYYQVILELGIIGVAIVIGYGFLIYFTISNPGKNIGVSLYQVAIFNLIALSVAAIFTYVFEVLWFQLVLILSVVYIWQQKLSLKSGRVWLVAIFITGALMAHHYGKYILHYQAYQQTSEARLLFKQGFYDEAVKLCSENYTRLRHDEKFLSLYSEALLYNGNFERCERVLAELIAIRNNYIYQRWLGQCYIEQKRYNQAEVALIKAINMVPNRFSPRFDLFNLYIGQKQYNKAYSTGNAIMQLPVKVPSSITAFIKKQTAERMIYLKK
ncbi:hypothetical protein FW774_16525 [Pedobacter sp. BS3]|uniref:O-antigen ligase family protein n=1 Tax=Pedobacter sp. BS3 TaxID=2567937 RepID=UPI0011ECABC7|nr:O-antigen ligase family protein [Pedobacter sp. BS3]TZF82289.1 hypothetical protein FW774_16525 [Pedobacter sp. BS3]